jgi:hypothetical protein
MVLAALASGDDSSGSPLARRPGHRREITRANLDATELAPAFGPTLDSKRSGRLSAVVELDLFDDPCVEVAQQAFVNVARSISDLLE